MKGGLLALGYETVLRQVATDGGRHHEELPGGSTRPCRAWAGPKASGTFWATGRPAPAQP